MAKEGLSSKQTVIVAIFALVGAIILGTLMFLGNIDAFLTQSGQ